MSIRSVQLRAYLTVRSKACCTFCGNLRGQDVDRIAYSITPLPAWRRPISVADSLSSRPGQRTGQGRPILANYWHLTWTTAISSHHTPRIRLPSGVFLRGVRLHAFTLRFVRFCKQPLGIEALTGRKLAFVRNLSQSTLQVRPR
jgi:hypothetical protein